MNTLVEIYGYTAVPTNPIKAFVYAASVQSAGWKQPRNIYAVLVDPSVGQVKNIRSRAIIRYKDFHVPDARNKVHLQIITAQAEIVATSWQAEAYAELRA